MLYCILHCFLYHVLCPVYSLLVVKEIDPLFFVVTVVPVNVNKLFALTNE